LFSITLRSMTQNWQPKHTQVSFLPVSHPFEQPQL